MRWKYLFLVSDNKNGNYEYNFVEDGNGDNNNFIFQFFSPPSFAIEFHHGGGGKEGKDWKDRNEMKFHSFVHSSFIRIQFSKEKGEKGVYTYLSIYSLSLSLSLDATSI